MTSKDIRKLVSAGWSNLTEVERLAEPAFSRPPVHRFTEAEIRAIVREELAELMKRGMRVELLPYKDRGGCCG